MEESLVYNKKGIDMFVKSSMPVPVKYNKSTGSIELKPKTVTYVDENIISANELLACYGNRISILPAELVEEIIKEEAEKVNEESAEDLEIDTTLDEGKEEDEGNEGTDEANEGEEGTDEANDGDEANTGDKDVDDFLNGKTDVVPDGTTEITEEEALKLKEEADKKAKEAEKANKKTETTKAKTNKVGNKQNKSKAGKNK